MDRPEEEAPVRSWMNEHPATTTYIAIVVTVILLLQILDTFFNLNIGAMMYALLR